jgi:hypothetical protein
MDAVVQKSSLFLPSWRGWGAMGHRFERDRLGLGGHFSAAPQRTSWENSPPSKKK